MVTNDRAVEFVEIAPRDGLQSIAEPIPTPEKISLIEGLLDAGFRRVEIGSFVNPKAVPQMADTKEITAALGRRRDIRLSVLVPNAKGAEIALENDCYDLVFAFSARKVTTNIP